MFTTSWVASLPPRLICLCCPSRTEETDSNSIAGRRHGGLPFVRWKKCESQSFCRTFLGQSFPGDRRRTDGEREEGVLRII